MSEQFDVVIVGARCAGAPLATLLARAGVRTAVVEQAAFPRDTLSSHLFEADGLAFLDRLGLTERLLGTGTRFANRADVRVEDVHVVATWPRRTGDVGGITSVRRTVLDPLLADAAAEAGAELRFETKVTGLVREGDRVAGVRTTAGDIGARLVVGADGRGSTVAELCGARSYNETPNGRGLYWAFFEGAEIGEPTFVTHRWADRFVLGIPSDGGLYQVLVWPELDELDHFRRDPAAALLEQARECEPVAAAIADATRVDKVRGAVSWTGFFRDPSGPGWVLAGDAGHFKDPGPGRGIADAFMQADALAPAISVGLEESHEVLDAKLADWGRWRDREFADHYWFAVDAGAGGHPPAVLAEAFRELVDRGETDLFLDLVNHRAGPNDVFTPARAARAVVAALKRRRGERGAVLRELAELGPEQVRREIRNRRPAYAAG
jgi:flavin-dependent dehydrogenase